MKIPAKASKISIHAPREGGDPGTTRRRHRRQISIHAPREGGDRALSDVLISTSISIHAPREGGDVVVGRDVTLQDISIHAPREGGDYHFRKMGVTHLGISIHAPREGGDAGENCDKSVQENFNPRPPRGGRPPSSKTSRRKELFQSTPPARGATRRKAGRN